jgi:transcriptional regulator with XRE-family HTH domain
VVWADDVAVLLGDRLRRGRHQSRLRQADVGVRAGVSQATISRMELGRGGTIGLDTWARVAAAAGLLLSAELRAAPAIDGPAPAARRCHALIAETARGAGWTAVTEITKERIGTVLVRRERGEVAVVRVWDSITSVDAAVDELRFAIARELEVRGPTVRVGGLAVAIRTAENRRRVTEGRETLREAIPASGGDWILALRHPRLAMPREPGLLWANGTGTRFKPTAHRPGWQ